MLLVTEKHNLYVIDQRNEIIAEGSWVSPVSSGQEDAGIQVTLGLTVGFRWVVQHRPCLAKKCEKLLKFLRLYLYSLLLYLRTLGCQGQYFEQLRKGNVPNFAIADEYLHPGRRAAQTGCLPSEACLCSKAHSGLFTYGSMQEFII